MGPRALGPWDPYGFRVGGLGWALGPWAQGTSGVLGLVFQGGAWAPHGFRFGGSGWAMGPLGFWGWWFRVGPGALGP